MQIEFSFGTHDPARHSRPWFGVIKGWPDKGPPVMAFGRLAKGTSPPKCTAEAQVGDIVRWGCKDLTTGQADPANSGFGMVSPAGGIVPLSQEDAKTARRRIHPEDANLAPVSLGGGGFRRGRGRAPTPAATSLPTLTPEEAGHIAALIFAATQVVGAWGDYTSNGPAASRKGQIVGRAVVALDGALAQCTQFPSAAPTPAPVAQPVSTPEPEVEVEAEPEVEVEAEPEAPPVVAVLATDEDGFPLF